jgi:hypothetical protein
VPGFNEFMVILSVAMALPLLKAEGKIGIGWRWVSGAVLLLLGLAFAVLWIAVAKSRV